MSDTCVFCSIVAGDIPARIIAENEHVIVFADRSPRAPVHYLIVPKVHVENIGSLKESQNDIASALVMMARQLGQKYGNQRDQGFNIISNNGASAGQVVFHMHWHFLAGKNIYAEGFSL